MKQESLLDFMTIETPNEKEQVVLDFSQSVGDPMVEKNLKLLALFRLVFLWS